MRYKLPLWALALANAPGGFVGGFTNVAAAILLRGQNVSAADTAFIVTLASSPMWWTFFFSPVIDVRFARRTYVHASGIASCALIVFSLFYLRDVTLFAVLLTGANVLALLYSTALIAWMVSFMEPESYASAAAGLQIANLGAAAAFGGVAVWLARALPPWCAALVLAAIFLAPQVLLLIFPKTAENPRCAREVFGTFFRDIWTLCKQRRCRYGLLVYLAPVCSFALPFPTVAPEFHVTERWAVLLNGPLMAGICSVGCLVSVWVYRWVPARMTYVLTGQVAALATLAMMGLAHSPAAYVTGLVLYSFLQGINYAAFAVVLYEIVGKDNPLGGTMTALLASVSNFPISMMGALDAAGLKYRGIQGMLAMDTFVALLFGIPLLFFFARVRRLGLEQQPEISRVEISA